MEVFAVGSDVLLKGSIPATITAINIRGNKHVTYEVSWWKDGVCNVQWFEKFMLTPTNNTASTKIGFK